MLKNKTHRFRRMSSAALIGLAIYGSSISSAWASELRNSRRQEVITTQKVERRGVMGDVSGEGLVKSLEGNNLVVTSKKDGRDFFVRVDEKTKVFEGFGKKGSFAQVKVGHRLFVKGKMVEGESNTILAKIVRDLSLNTRHLK